MRTAEDRELDSHLDLWARKAGFVFGLGLVAQSFAAARARDPSSIMFLLTANEITDLLVDVAQLAPIEATHLPAEGTTSVDVPNGMILTARALVTHWERLARQAGPEAKPSLAG